MSAVEEQIQQDNELFDTEPYTVPYPKRDGFEVSKIVERFTGSFERDRNNPEDAEKAASARYGQMRKFTVICSLAGRTNATADEGSVSETLVWKIHSVEDE
jgi:hypothetical protein